MIYDHFRISDTDGRVLEISDLLRADVKGERSIFDPRWYETVSLTMKNPTMSSKRENKKSETNVESMVARSLEQKTREKTNFIS